MVAIPFNPYIVGNPIKTKEMFFGREDDFRYVVRKIGEGRSNQILVFCGERRSGKTSILFQILGGRLGDRFLPVLVDMQILAGIKDDRHFFKTILKVACNNLNLPGLSLEILERQAGPESIEGLFEQFLIFVEEQFPDRIVLFLLDEYELIEEKIRDGSLSESTIHYLAGVLESPYRISFIFTGSTNLENRKVSFWRSLLGKSIYRKISYLSQKDTFRLISEPLKDYVRHPEEVKRSIYRLTGGQPFYTQVICQNLIDHLIEEERSQSTSQDLELIVKDIVDNPLPQMIYSWNSLSDGHKLLLSALGGLLEGPEDWTDAARVYAFLKKNRIKLPFKRARLNILLEEAYHTEALEKRRNQQYRFKLDLLRRWIQREHSIWKVAREIGLELRKAPVPLPLAAAVALIVAAGVVVWIRGWPFQHPERMEEPALIRPEPAEEIREVRDIKLKAGTGPFRAVIDEQLNLTSEGSDDETTIVVPSLEEGIHRFNFYLPATDESVNLTVEIKQDNQVLQVAFSRIEPAEESSAEPAQPVVQAEAKAGSLFLLSEPVGALIVLNGESSGFTTPHLFEDLEPGEYMATILHEGFKEETITVTVEEDRISKAEVALQKAYGKLLFDVRPTAKILLDGEYLIDTPYVKPVEVQTGTHTLTIINESLGVEKKREIHIEEGQTQKIVEVLK